MCWLLLWLLWCLGPSSAAVAPERVVQSCLRLQQIGLQVLPQLAQHGKGVTAKGFVADMHAGNWQCVTSREVVTAFLLVIAASVLPTAPLTALAITPARGAMCITSSRMWARISMVTP